MPAAVVGPYCAQYTTRCLCGCGTWVRPGDGVWKYDGDPEFFYKQGHYPQTRFQPRKEQQP